MLCTIRPLVTRAVPVSVFECWVMYSKASNDQSSVSELWHRVMNPWACVQQAFHQWSEPCTMPRAVTFRPRVAGFVLGPGFVYNKPYAQCCVCISGGLGHQLECTWA